MFPICSNAKKKQKDHWSPESLLIVSESHLSKSVPKARSHQSTIKKKKKYETSEISDMAMGSKFSCLKKWMLDPKIKDP